MESNGTCISVGTGSARMTKHIKHEIICKRMALSMERGLVVMLSVLVRPYVSLYVVVCCCVLPLAV